MIPDLPVEVEANTTSMVIQTLTYSVRTVGVVTSIEPGISYLYLVILALIIIALVIIVLLAPLRGEPPISVIRGVMGKSGGSWEPQGAYVYKGLRWELRRVYELLLARLRSQGYSPPRGYTVSEVARAYSSVIGGLGRFAEIYNSYMYSPLEPSESVVEEARRIAGGES